MEKWILVLDKFLDFINVPIRNWQSLSSKKYSNDKKIFSESNEILNEEQMLYLLDSAYGLRFSQKQNKKQQDYTYYFLRSENIDNKIISKVFNDKNLQELHEQFLIYFIDTFKHVDWCVSEKDNNFIELNPNLKSFDNEKYLKEMNYIQDLSYKATNAYKKYRKKIKQKFGF